MQATKLPALYLGHGAPILLEDELWTSQLASWGKTLEKPKAILIVSAHWESAPLSLSSIEPADLIYDFSGFHPKYYNLQYKAPVAPELAKTITDLLSDTETVVQTNRGLDHGAYIPLMNMYPDADIPVIQMSMPTLNPERLYKVGQKLATLREQGVLIIASGFVTHGLPYIDMSDPNSKAPNWSSDFDLWTKEALETGNFEELLKFKNAAPALQYAHPTVEHFAPIFVTLGASSSAEQKPETTIDGFWYGLSKRSFQVD